MGEDFMLRQMFSGGFMGGAEIWLAVAYLVCMFVVIAFRPQQIASSGSFTLSYVLFALYFIVPSGVNAFASFTMMDGGMGRGGGGQVGFMMMQLSGFFGKVLLGLSIIFALNALYRRKASDYAPPPIRDRHDDREDDDDRPEREERGSADRR